MFLCPGTADSHPRGTPQADSEVNLEAVPVDEDRVSTKSDDTIPVQRVGGVPDDSAEQLHTAMQASPIGFCLVATDGSFLKVNKALCDLLGRDEQALRVCTWQELTHPDDVDMDQQLVDEILSGTRDTYRITKRYLRPDGSQVWGDLSVGCVRDESGAVRHFISQILDVTRERFGEEALVRSQEAYKLLAENASDLVFRSNAELELDWLSPSVRQALGWAPSELLGTSVRELVHPDDAPGLATTARTAAHGAPVSYRARFRRQDGGFTWLAITARPIFDARGVLVGRIGSGRNIDAEQAALDALAEQNEYLRAVIDSELDARVLVRPLRDEAGSVVDLVYVDANPQAAKDLGRDREAIVGAGMLDLFPSQRGSGLFERYLHTLDTGEPLILDDVALPGDITDDIQHIDVRAFQVRDGLSITWRYVTERHEAQNALARSEARYRLLAENSSDIVVVGDTNGVLTWVSPSVTEHLGWATEDLVGRPFSGIVHDDDRAAVQEVHKGLSAGRQGRVTTRIRSAAGDWQWYDILVRPVTDEAGELVGGVAGWRNIQEQHELQHALRQSQQRFQLIAENAVEVVLLLNEALNITWTSPSAQRLTGLDVEELQRSQAWGLVHPDDREMIRNLLEASFASAQAAQAEVRFRSGEGQFQYWLATVRPTDGTTGRELVVGLRNVDAEVRARQEARAQHASRIAVLDSMLDPHVLLKAIRDSRGTIIDFLYVDANDAACEYNRISRDDLVGASLMDLLPGHKGTGLFAQYCHTVNTGEPLILDDYVYPHEILAEPRRYDIRAVKVGDALSFTWRDVTERSEAADRLAQSERRFRLLADNSADTVLLASDGVMRWLSPSLHRMLGYLPEEWVGRRFEEFTHPDDTALAQRRRVEITEGASKFTRLRMRHKDGGYHWIDINAAPLLDTYGGKEGIVAAMRTSDELVQYERALAMSEERFRLIATNTGDVLELADVRGALQWVSPSLTLALRRPPAQRLARAALECVHPDDHPAARQHRQQVLDGQDSTARLRILDARGNYHWAESRATQFVDDAGDLQGLLCAMTIIDERVAWEESLRHRASHDPLTGLITREEAYRRLTFMLQRTGTKTFLAFLDMDNLKEVNDTLGHPAGDELLRIVAKRTRNLLRDADQVARVGGDEMLLILPGVQDTEAALNLMARLLAAVSEVHPLPDGHTLRPRMSIGLTEIRRGEDIEDAVHRADSAMYTAKAKGGDRVEVAERS